MNTAGIISKKQNQTPNAHVREKSFEEPLLLIFKISGMLNKGRTTLATTPNVLITLIVFMALLYNRDIRVLPR
ncbi:MAG: hypothetical protein O6929_07925 [candidate division NC10 bacterium]|nr:hypothetical protein [candidate division NC10 bacterium]